MVSLFPVLSVTVVSLTPYDHVKELPIVPELPYSVMMLTRFGEDDKYPMDMEVPSMSVTSVSSVSPSVAVHVSETVSPSGRVIPDR